VIDASEDSGLRLSFYGGAGTVTGSRYLLEAGGQRLLVDCGMFQGLKELRLMNWRRPEFDPSAIEALLLTHAHLDHVGYIPRLVREGFHGPIYCTRPTIDLAEVLLLDAAKLQEEDASYANRKGYSKHSPALPLYTARDVHAAMRRFQRLDYGDWRALDGSVRVRLHNSGHILGSATIEVEVPALSGTRRVAFSGDLGRYGVPLHADPDPPPAVDALVIESTYGDRVHSTAPLIDQIRAPFDETLGRGGTVLIPSFALARAQLVTLMLGELMDAGELPRVPVHVDSPMAVEISRIYSRYLESGGLDDDLESDDGSSKLLPPEVEFHRTVSESKTLNRLDGPRIIISSSGMLTGGRVLHHLRRLMPDPKNLIVLVGYQAPGTRGRALLDGAQALRMHGQDIPVRAKVLSVEGISAHADANELMRWLRSGEALPGVVFVTHGEPEAAAALAQRIEAEHGIRSLAPSIGDRIDLESMLVGRG
jgi:metallo-beta-lactamase family protein